MTFASSNTEITKEEPHYHSELKGEHIKDNDANDSTNNQVSVQHN